MASKKTSGWFGTFFMGLTLGIVAAPCLGPFILGLLTYVGQRGDPVLGFLYFFVLSIGMGLPLALLAVFSSAIDRLPLSGDWMLWVRKGMGWVMMGMAAYLISPLLENDHWKSALMAGVLMAAGIHLGWVDKTGKTLRRFSNLKRAAGVLLPLIAVLIFAADFREKEEIQWIPYHQDVIAKAAKDHQPLILDFYADWCSPCKAMDEKVFSSRDVVSLSRSFVTVRLDLTRRLPFQEEVLKGYDVRGVPTVIFLNRGGEEERDLRVEALVGKNLFLKRMKTLLDS
jgi:thiol:disulfide interchange protein DsbD